MTFVCNFKCSLLVPTPTERYPQAISLKFSCAFDLCRTSVICILYVSSEMHDASNFHTYQHTSFAKNGENTPHTHVQIPKNRLFSNFVAFFLLNIFCIVQHNYCLITMFVMPPYSTYWLATHTHTMTGARLVTKCKISCRAVPWKRQ